MTATSTQDPTLALVHEGWNHLMSQRPLAAWGTWQRALRLDANSIAARQALETLEAAPELPLAAARSTAFGSPPAKNNERGGIAFCVMAQPQSCLMPPSRSAV